jgi:hypothetical protein
MTKDQKIARLTLGLQNIIKYALNQQAREMASNTLDLDKPMREMVPLTYDSKDGG